MGRTQYIADCFARHAPEGFTIAEQFFDGESRNQALLEVADHLNLPVWKLAVRPGHFELTGSGRWEFVEDGWMVFVREEDAPWN